MGFTRLTFDRLFVPDRGFALARPLLLVMSVPLWVSAHHRAVPPQPRGGVGALDGAPGRKAEAQELARPRRGDRALRLVDLELETLGQELLDARHHPQLMSLDQAMPLATTVDQPMKKGPVKGGAKSWRKRI